VQLFPLPPAQLAEAESVSHVMGPARTIPAGMAIKPINSVLIIVLVVIFIALVSTVINLFYKQQQCYLLNSKPSKIRANFLYS
jgi:hypothetical protein